MDESSGDIYPFASLQVQQMFPHMEFSSIVSDLRRTRSIIATVDNILEGSVSYSSAIPFATSLPSTINSDDIGLTTVAHSSADSTFVSASAITTHTQPTTSPVRGADQPAMTGDDDPVPMESFEYDSVARENGSPDREMKYPIISDVGLSRTTVEKDAQYDVLPASVVDKDGAMPGDNAQNTSNTTSHSRSRGSEVQYSDAVLVLEEVHKAE